MPGPIYAIPRRQNYGRPQSIAHNNFSAGMVTNFDSMRIPENAAVDIVNFDTNPTGELSTRPGITNADISNITPLPNPYALIGQLNYVLLGIIPDYGNNALDIAVYAYSNGIDTGFFQTLTSASTTYVSLNRINTVDLSTTTQLIVYSGVLYFYSNLSNTDHSFKCSPSGSGLATFSSPYTTSYYIFRNRVYLYKNRVYFAVDNLLYFSKAGSPDIWTGDPDTGNLPIGNDIGGIRAMSAVRDVLYIFRETSLHALYGDPVLNGSIKLINNNFGSDHTDVGQYRDIIYFAFKGYIYELINGIVRSISYQLTPFSYNFYGPNTSVFSFYREKIFYRNFVYNIQTKSWTKYDFSNSLGVNAFKLDYRVLTTLTDTYYYEQPVQNNGPRNLWKFVDSQGYDDISGTHTTFTCSLTTRRISGGELVGMNRLYGIETQQDGPFTSLAVSAISLGSGLSGAVNPITVNSSYGAQASNTPSSIKLATSLRGRAFQYIITLVTSTNALRLLGFVEIIRPKQGVDSQVSTP